MNVRKENHAYAIAEKLRGHQQVATMGLNYHDRLRARRNFIRLSATYPHLAQEMYVPTMEEVKKGPFAKQETHNAQ